jgi:uncharacterized damage-inducible protein DinB
VKRTPRSQVQKIERIRSELLGRLEMLDPSLLAQRPEAGRWSIGEIVEHLVLAERDVMPGLFDGSKLQTRERSLKDRLAYHLVMLLLRSPIRVRTPSSGMAPSERRSLNELRKMWEENHTTLRAFVESSDSSQQRAALAFHPVAGPMTLRQALRMLEVHLSRHVRQIRNLERGLR